MRYKKNVGDMGEDFAAQLLENSGFSILQRNYRTKVGEIDIIATKDGVLHFIEVKTRNGDQYGYPSEAVTQTKQQRIRKCAEAYLQNRRVTWQKVSFDVYEIMTDLIENLQQDQIGCLLWDGRQGGICRNGYFEGSSGHRSCRTGIDNGHGVQGEDKKRDRKLGI